MGPSDEAQVIHMPDKRVYQALGPVLDCGRPPATGSFRHLPAEGSISPDLFTERNTMSLLTV